MDTKERARRKRLGQLISEGKTDDMDKDGNMTEYSRLRSPYMGKDWPKEAASMEKEYNRSKANAARARGEY